MIGEKFQRENSKLKKYVYLPIYLSIRLSINAYIYIYIYIYHFQTRHHNSYNFKRALRNIATEEGYYVLQSFCQNVEVVY